uniref:Uncharacterized protein n=1 Tax=Arion vulgaris TaxID=1028688 RepID=A0A0B6Z507_9EUPU
MDPFNIAGHRITDNRKGSLTLRSNKMNYSRAILNSEWHQARQAEPKDYDLSKHDVRSMNLSTYNRIGNITDGTLPETTYQEQANQIFLKPWYEHKDNHKGMVQPESVANANASIDRDTGDPKGAFGSVLPYHNAEHNKFHLDTTYNLDYIPPYPFTRQNDKTEDENKNFEDKAVAYRKMKSQFTDTVDYRRNGWNTWQDESGIYANSQYKAQVFPKTKVIP